MNKLFQDELSYLRDAGREFSRLNPKLAKYLSERSTDPDVERLLEGFAFLTSRVREKIDDEMSEFTHSVISLLWPNFLRPFPSTTMMKFTPEDRAITQSQKIERGTTFFSRPVQGDACPFRTTADCIVYPLEIGDSHLQRTHDSARLRIDFVSLSGSALREAGIGNLRLTLCGDPVAREMLYLWMGRYLRSLRIVFGSESRTFDIERSFRPIGFGTDEAILPQKITAFEGHRILQEYFVFPDKFYGYDLLDLGRYLSDREERDFSLEFDFERSIPANVRIRPDTVRLYCVPAVNLFSADADPLIINHRKTAYRIRPHGETRGDAEIFSIDAVECRRPSEDKGRITVVRSYPRFESFAHEVGENWRGEQVYYRSRAFRSVMRRGFEHELSFVHHNTDQAVPSEEALSVSLTCFNRKNAHELSVAGISNSTDASPVFVSFSNITRPTAVVYPPTDGALNWNLISNLSLNYMSLLSRDALAAILAIYDYKSASDRQSERAAKQRLDGVLSLTTRPVDKLFKGLPVRGLRSEIKMRESAFHSEGEMYLFAAVLAEFFSLYATVNSFHELQVLGQENGEIYTWTPRIGRQPLI